MNMVLIRHLCLIALLLTTFPVWAQTPFFSVLPDVPLMPGMTEQDAQSFSFDKPAGRIVQSAGFIQDADEAMARTFYKKTLPQFGWAVRNQKQDQDVYTRETETLTLTFEPHETGLIVYFLLSPA